MAKSKITIKMNLNKFVGKLNREIERRMTKIAILLVAYVKTSLSTSNNGGKNPSQPGGAPHAGTGTLRNSITYQVTTDFQGVVAKYGVAKGPASKYARRLELGFTGKDSKGRMIDQAARPYLKPSFKNNKRKIIQILKRG